MRTIYYSLSILLLVFLGYSGSGQKLPKWGSNYQLSSKLLIMNLSEDKVFPDSINLRVHPLFQVIPGMGFVYFRNKTGYRIDINYAENYTNSKDPVTDSTYYSEANQSDFFIQLGLEHKFLPGKIYPYFFALLTMGYHNAQGDAHGGRQSLAFDFKTYDVYTGITCGYGMYFFLFKQLSFSPELYAFMLNRWNYYSVNSTTFSYSSNKTDFSLRIGAMLELNYYFFQKQ